MRPASPTRTRSTPIGLDGIDSSGFIQGTGRVYQRRVHATGSWEKLLELPGLGELRGGCQPDGTLILAYWNTSGETVDVLVDDGGTSPSHTQVINQAGPPLADISQPNARLLVQLGRGT